MTRVAIVGVGHSKFGDRRDVSLPELAFEAAKPAFQDANLTPKDVDFLSVGIAGTWYEDFLPAVLVSEYLGLEGKGLVRCEAACATGSAALVTACNMIRGGQSDVAMALGVEKMFGIDGPTMTEVIGRAGYYLWEFHNFGMTFPGYYALYATEHMKRYGTTEKQLAEVAVKNHKYGALNPNAHFQRPLTLQDALSSRVVAWPLKLYDCCPVSDGAAAVIVASEEKAKSLTDSPVWVEATGISSDTANITKRGDLLGLRASVNAAQSAFKKAHVQPKQLDVADVHDCFTIAEILAYEDLGFCERGKGGQMIDEGQTEIGGKIPVNLDGGLKSKGHPLGATGTSMIVGLTRQLRNQAGKSQAPIKNGLALAHNVGGTGHYCYVTILRS
ncbi:MAG: thiolase domain-containing protein [Candidatus Bathyarchaeia archaeon]